MLRYCTGCFNLLLFKWCKLANTEIWANPRWGHQFFGHMNRFCFFFLLSPPSSKTQRWKVFTIRVLPWMWVFFDADVNFHQSSEKGDAGLQTLTNSCFGQMIHNSAPMSRRVLRLSRKPPQCGKNPFLLLSWSCAVTHLNHFAPDAVDKLCQLLSEDAASLSPQEWGVPQIQSTFPPGSSGGHERPHVRDHISGEDTQRNHAFINNTSKSIFSLEMSCMERKKSSALLFCSSF